MQNDFIHRFCDIKSKYFRRSPTPPQSGTAVVWTATKRAVFQRLRPLKGICSSHESAMNLPRKRPKYCLECLVSCEPYSLDMNLRRKRHILARNHSQTAYFGRCVAGSWRSKGGPSKDPDWNVLSYVRHICSAAAPWKGED